MKINIDEKILKENVECFKGCTMDGPIEMSRNCVKHISNLCTNIDDISAINTYKEILNKAENKIDPRPYIAEMLSSMAIDIATIAYLLGIKDDVEKNLIMMGCMKDE